MNLSKNEIAKSLLMDAGAPALVVESIDAIDGTDYAMLSATEREVVGLLAQRGRKWQVTVSFEKPETERAEWPAASEKEQSAMEQFSGDGWSPLSVGVVNIEIGHLAAVLENSHS